MKADDLPPMDDLLKRELEHERSTFEAPPDAARVALTERLRPMLDDGAMVDAPRPRRSPLDLASKGGLLKAGLIFLAGAGTGAVAATASRAPTPAEIRYVDVERVVVREVEAGIPTSSASTASPAVPPPPPPLAPSAPPPPVVVDDKLAEERSIVETTRSALARRDSALALVEVHEHELRFSRGRLVEEREALAIQALVLAGRDEDARARAARFRARYPESLFLPVVEAAVGGRDR